MRFGRASGLPEQLLDENNPLEDLAAELRARSDPLEDNLYRNMVIRLARLFRAQQRGSSAKVWTASGEFDDKMKFSLIPVTGYSMESSV